MMNNSDTHECLTCGHTWKHGLSGSHSCSKRLKRKLEAVEKNALDLIDFELHSEFYDRIGLEVEKEETGNVYFSPDLISKCVVSEHVINNAKKHGKRIEVRQEGIIGVYYIYQGITYLADCRQAT